MGFAILLLLWTKPIFIPSPRKEREDRRQDGLKTWIFQSQTGSSEKLGLASGRVPEKLLSKWVFDIEVNSLRSTNLEVWQKCNNQFVFSIVAKRETT